ncbi:MAG: DUF5362 family protein [Chloroflexota bacterium]
MAEYEFNTEENQTFAALASRMRWVGGLTAVLGLLALIFAVARYGRYGLTLLTIGQTLEAVVLIVTGVVIYRPADNFRRIVSESSGTDISELMTAMQELDSGFNLLNILVVVNIASLLANIILAIG